jgi:hypothetical protein
MHPRLFASHLFIAAPTPTHSLRCVCGISWFVAPTISDIFESTQYIFDVSYKTQPRRRHRTDCAAFRFLLSVSKGSAECNRPLRMRGCVFARVCAVSAAVCALAQIYTIFTVTMCFDSVLSIAFVLRRSQLVDLRL